MLGSCMLRFKHNSMAIRTFHAMLTTHLADLLSHVPGLVAPLRQHGQLAHYLHRQESPDIRCMAYLFEKLASGTLPLATHNHQTRPPQIICFPIDGYFASHRWANPPTPQSSVPQTIASHVGG